MRRSGVRSSSAPPKNLPRSIIRRGAPGVRERGRPLHPRVALLFDRSPLDASTVNAYTSSMPRPSMHARAVAKPSPDFLSRRSEEHTSELQSLMRISYAVFCLKKKKNKQIIEHNTKDYKMTPSRKTQ